MPYKMSVLAAFEEQRYAHIMALKSWEFEEKTKYRYRCDEYNACSHGCTARAKRLEFTRGVLFSYSATSNHTTVHVHQPCFGTSFHTTTATLQLRVSEAARKILKAAPVVLNNYEVHTAARKRSPNVNRSTELLWLSVLECIRDLLTRDLSYQLQASTLKLENSILCSGHLLLLSSTLSSVVTKAMIVIDTFGNVVRLPDPKKLYRLLA